MPQKTINMFKDDFEFLSNFYPSPIMWDGYSWPTVEHIYQAAKVYAAGVRRLIRESSTPAMAKYFGRKVELRLDWEDVKSSIMYELLKLKFFPNTDLAKKLLSTGEVMLIEGNYWHDNTWGDCYCDKCKDIKGENLLGYILMLVREDLKNGRTSTN